MEKRGAFRLASRWVTGLVAKQKSVPSDTGPVGHPTLWRSRNFLLLWGGQTAGELGSRISSVAIPVLAVSTPNASVFQVSLLTFFTWLPYLLFSLPAGLIADRLDPRRLMITSDLIRMVAMSSVPVVALVGEMTLHYLYVVVGICGVLTVLFNVAYKSMLPRMVDARQLVEGNSKLVMSQEFAELVGPTISGALIGLVGAARTFFSNGLTFLVSATVLWLMRMRPAPEDATADPGRLPLRVQMTEGLGFIRRQPILLKILATTTTSNFFVMATAGVDVTFMLRELSASPLMVGLVSSISATGGLVVGALGARLTSWIGSARVIWVAMAAPGPLYLLMPLAQPGWGVLIFGIGLAAFSANTVLFNVAAMSYRQSITPSRLLGRVNAAFLWICYGAIPLGALFGGTLAEQVGLRPALWTCVLGMWSASLFVIFSPLRRMRDLPPVPGRR
jgi:MFS family permease